MASVYTVHYNFCRIHKTLRVTPAMEIGLDETARDCAWIQPHRRAGSEAESSEDVPQACGLIMNRTFATIVLLVCGFLGFLLIQFGDSPQDRRKTHTYYEDGFEYTFKY